ncbi:MAG: divalent-cation tolerance protein CutA, partial [Verrucomicrobiales bacterium]
MKPLLVISSFPDAQTARQIGTTLVLNQLAACVNIVPGVESIYRWDGKIENENEALALIKTSAEVWPRLEQELRELHPYEVPEIIALDIE